MATSLSKFSPCLAHKRVSQVGMTTSFSRFCPCIAHTKGWVKLKKQHPSLNSTPALPLHGPQKGGSSWGPLPSLNFTPALPTERWVKLKWQHPSLNFMATSFSKFYPCMAHQRLSQLGQHPCPNFTPAWPTKGWGKLERPFPGLNFAPALPT